MIAQRLTAQLIAGEPARDPLAVVERILAVQGQDPRGARLAIRTRTTGLVAADVDRALSDERALVISWLNRGTLHLVRSEDYPWLQALTTPPLRTGSARRLAQEGVPPDAVERGVAAIERALVEHGPLTRDQLAEHVARADVRTRGQALYHLLFQAALRGLVVRGPFVERGQHAFALTRDWLGPAAVAAIARVDRDRALAELARRYLAGHGPAGERDLARWAGIGLRDARAGLRAIASELAERDDGLLDLAGRPPVAPLPPPRLLGPFDPLLHGWIERAALLDEHAQAIVTRNGIFKPFALVDGRAAATWTMPASDVVLEPFAPLDDAVAAALEAEAADLRRFLG